MKASAFKDVAYSKTGKGNVVAVSVKSPYKAMRAASSLLVYSPVARV